MGTAGIISIKADLDEAMDMLKELDGNKFKMRKRILSGIGVAVKGAIKKSYKGILGKKSGTLQKGIVSKVLHSGKEVLVTSEGRNGDVRYGYVLAKGAIIKPKHSKFLSFQVGGKWIQAHQVTIPARDWFEKPAKRYMESLAYKQKLEQLTQREITKAEKAAQKRNMQ